MELLPLLLWRLLFTWFAVGSPVYMIGAGIAVGIGIAFLMGSEGGEKALLVALSAGAGYAFAKLA
jgi:hypothetical protein